MVQDYKRRNFFWWGQPSPIDIVNWYILSVKVVKKEVEFCNCTDLCFFCRSDQLPPALWV